MKTFTCRALIVLVSVITLSAKAAIDKPVVMDEAMISITVSDFHGFMNEVGGVAAQISPMMSGEMIKGMIGMQLGDPSLAGIPAGSGLSVVALDITNIFAVVEVAEAQSTGYINAAQAKGLQAQYADGALVLASNTNVLTNGVTHLSRVKSKLLAARSPTLRIAMQPATMIDRTREAIDGFMTMLPGLMGQSMMSQPGATLDSAQSMTKILEAELIFLLSVAEQCEVAEVVLAPKGGSLQINETFVPKAGTALAALVNAPAVNKVNPKLQAGVLGEGMILFDFHYANLDALATFVAIETEKLMKQLKVEDVDTASIVSNMKKWMGIYGGTGCQLVDFGDEDEMQVRYVMEVRDEASVLEVLKNMPADMAPFLKLYESMGVAMTMEFKENASKAGEVNVHQLMVKMDCSAMPAAQQEQMKEMGLENMVYDLAITDGMMFYSAPGEMATLIKKVKEGDAATRLKARSVYPEGGFYYFDLDMGEYMAFAASILPDTPETSMVKQQMSVLFAGVEPVTSAGFKQGGQVMWSLNLPGELLAKYGQMIMMMQMQQMQQQQVDAPPAAPAQ